MGALKYTDAHQQYDHTSDLHVRLDIHGVDTGDSVCVILCASHDASESCVSRVTRPGGLQFIFTIKRERRAADPRGSQSSGEEPRTGGVRTRRGRSGAIRDANFVYRRSCHTTM